MSIEDNVDDVHDVGDIHFAIVIDVGGIEDEYFRFVAEDVADARHHIGDIHLAVTIDVAKQDALASVAQDDRIAGGAIYCRCLKGDVAVCGKGGFFHRSPVEIFETDSVAGNLVAE